jgi:hypothetical protein
MEQQVVLLEGYARSNGYGDSLLSAEYVTLSRRIRDASGSGMDMDISPGSSSAAGALDPSAANNEIVDANGQGVHPIDAAAAPITNDEVISTLHRLANNEAVDERLGVPPAEMARMVDSNARFRASMGPLSVSDMLSLRDEFQSAFDSIGAAPSTSELTEQVRASMPPSAQVYEFSDATYVVEPSTNTGIAVRSGSSGVSFSLHADGIVNDALALARESIDGAKSAEKERGTAERRHKKLKDTFNAKVAEKAGYYKQYAKQVRRVGLGCLLSA